MLSYGCFLVILCLLEVKLCEDLPNCMERPGRLLVDYKRVFNVSWILQSSFNTEVYTSNLRCVRAFYSEETGVRGKDEPSYQTRVIHTGIKNSTNERISLNAKGNSYELTSFQIYYTDAGGLTKVTVLDSDIEKFAVFHYHHNDRFGCRIWLLSRYELKTEEAKKEFHNLTLNVLNRHGLAYRGYVPMSQENCDVSESFVPQFLGTWYQQSSYKTEEVDGDLRCVYSIFYLAGDPPYYKEKYEVLHRGINTSNTPNKWIDVTGGFHFVDGKTKEKNSAFTLKFLYSKDDYNQSFHDYNPMKYVLGTDFTSYAVIRLNDFHSPGYKIWLLSREQFPPTDFYDNCKKILKENGIEYKGFKEMDQKNCSLLK